MCQNKMRKLKLLNFAAVMIFLCFDTRVDAVRARKIPRFVSLNFNFVKLRYGPGKQYPIKWIVRFKGMPVKIIAEYETWRQIQCFDNTVGWIHKSLLTGKRSVIITDKVNLFSSSSLDSTIVAQVLPYNIASIKLKKSTKHSIYVTLNNLSGWVDAKCVWGY